MVDLAGEQKKMPENLSGGMRKRVGLARTIVATPGMHPLRRADDWPRPDRHGLDQPPDSSLAKASAGDFRRRHARHENRLSHRRSASRFCTRAASISRRTGRPAAVARPHHPGFHRRPFRRHRLAHEHRTQRPRNLRRSLPPHRTRQHCDDGGDLWPRQPGADQDLPDHR